MQNQTFRLFVSSPFSDFKKERDVLHKKVFPKIDKYCNENGFSFQPVDLRWGVSAEAQLDQKTLEVCLEEVRGCKYFPHPNFLIMAGDRYGYIPLPYMIEKAEFDKIKEIYENDKEKISINYEAIKDEKGEVLIQKTPKKLEKLELLDEWYKLDENQIPISYILKPRANEYKEYSNWEVDQEYLRTILQNAANMLFENKEDKEYQKYFTSATEAEVLEGILEYKDITHTQEKLLENKIVENSKLDKEYVYGYIRTIQNPTGKYIDSIKDKEKEEFLKQKAIDFKTNLSNTLDLDKNILTSAYDSIELYEENQLKEFEEFIYEKLIKAIETQKNKSNEISHIQIEIIEQEKFKNDKQKGFIGRKNTLDKIENYVLNDKTNEPLVIYGISGMGKSSLIAKAIDNVSKLIDKESLIYRFVGATQNSTTIRSLLISICDELANKNIIEKIEKYEFKEYKFFKQINETLSNIKKSIVLFIDALDQLQFKDSLQWLPKNLPNSLKIVFSVLNDEKYKEDNYYYSILKNSVNSNNLIDISNDSLESSKEFLIKNLLFDLDRKIDDYQTNYLLNKWKETNYSPLYLKIAIEEVKHWKSGDTSQILESNVEGIVKEYIKNLSKTYHHEEIFVNKVFGYIHASKDGLSEKELLEILSEDLEDEILMKDKIINEYHEPIKIKNPRRENKEELILPMSIWSRLHTQIKPFIIQRNIDNQPLIKFFHRQFTSVIDSLIEVNKIQLHTKLSKYFYTLQDKSKTWNKRYHNLHMLNEYPYQLFHSKQSKELKEILFDLEFAGSVYDNNKQENFRDIMSKAKQLENITEDEIYPWESFYIEKEHLIVKINDEMWKAHQSLFQLAYEDGDDSPLTKEAKRLIKEKKIEFEWLKIVNRRKNFSRTGLLKVLEGHSDKIKGVKILEDGKILSYSDDKTLILWDKEGNSLKILEGHRGSIKGVKILEDGRILSYSEYDSTLRLWDKEGNILKVLEGHIGSIIGVEILEDGRILSYSYDRTLRLWDKEGNSLKILEGHRGSIIGVKILEDGRILSYSEYDSTLRLWDKEGNILKVLEGHSDKIKGVKILEDGKILSYSEYKFLILWDSEGNELNILKGHSDKIKGVKILEDGKILSYSDDKTLILWDKEGNLLKILEGHSNKINGVEILEDGRILSYSKDSTLRFWDKEGNILKILEGHSNSIIGVKILEDGRILSYSYDRTLRLWDKEGNSLKILEGHSNSINGVEILEDGKILSYSDDKTLILWDKDGNLLKILEGYRHSIHGVEILEDGKILSYSRDGDLILWDSEGSNLNVLEGHSESIYRVEILEDGRILSYSNDSTLRLWDSEGNKLNILKGHSDKINGVEILEDGRILSYSLDKTLRLWDSEGNILKILEGHSDNINGVEILEDGKILSYSEYDFTPRLWDKEGNLLKILEGHSESVYRVEILEDGRILSYSTDSTLRLWDSEGNKLNILKGHSDYIYRVEILEDGRILSYSSDNTPRLWDKEGNLLKILEGHSDEIRGVEILEDGRILSYSKDKTLRFWDKDGNLLKILEGHTNFVKGVEILEDGRILSYSLDKTLRLWDSEGNILKILEGHSDNIDGVKILEDGRILSYSEFGGTLILWDKDGNLLKILDGHSKWLNGVEILENGRILSYSEDSTLRLWDSEGNILKVLEEHRGPINGVEILEDGRIISYSEDRTFRLWSSKGELIKVFYLPAENIDRFIIKKDKKIVIGVNRFFIYEDFTKMNNIDINEKII